MKKSIKFLTLMLCCLSTLTGCGLMEKTNYETTEEAQVKCQQLLKEKYNIDFEISNGEICSSTKDSGEEYKYYHADITSPDGISAKVGLLQESDTWKQDMDLGTNYLNLNMDYGCMQDTYSETYYTKLTREKVDNILQNEDLSYYYIRLDNPHYAGGDLTLTAEEYMDEAETAYWIDVVFKDEKTAEENARNIEKLVNKLVDENVGSFFFTCYADNIEIYSITYSTSENYTGLDSYDDILYYVKGNIIARQPIPNEKYLLNDFYNGEE